MVALDIKSKGGIRVKKTLLALVNDEPEVLMRVTGLLRRKGIKIKNISMNEIEDFDRAFLTITFLLENHQRMSEIYYSIREMENVIQLEEVRNENALNQFNFLENTNELKMAL